MVGGNHVAFTKQYAWRYEWRKRRRSAMVCVLVVLETLFESLRRFSESFRFGRQNVSSAGSPNPHLLGVCCPNLFCFSGRLKATSGGPTAFKKQPSGNVLLSLFSGRHPAQTIPSFSDASEVTANATNPQGRVAQTPRLLAQKSPFTPQRTFPAQQHLQQAQHPRLPQPPVRRRRTTNRF